MKEGRWLTKNQYGRIRYRAKKLGAKYIGLSHIHHFVQFEYTTVVFAFRPFVCHANVSGNDAYRGTFTDRDSAEKIKKDIDTALEFMDFLKKFNEEIDKGDEK